MIKNVMFLFFVIAVLFACSKSETAKQPVGQIDCTTVNYNSIVQPFFAAHCNDSGCHNAGSPDGDFTTYSKLRPYVNNGTIRSEVITRQSMPIGSSLNSNQLGQIQCWLDAGGLNN